MEIPFLDFYGRKWRFILGEIFICNTANGGVYKSVGGWKHEVSHFIPRPLLELLGVDGAFNNVQPVAD